MEELEDIKNGYYDGTPIIPPEIERMTIEELNEKIKEFEEQRKKEKKDAE